jgi:hypothetical protein
MTFETRLDRLEDLIGEPECRTCAERPTFTIRRPGDEAPAPCRECGRTPEAFTIDIGEMKGETGCPV